MGAEITMQLLVRRNPAKH